MENTLRVNETGAYGESGILKERDRAVGDNRLSKSQALVTFVIDRLRLAKALRVSITGISKLAKAA